MSVHNAQTNSQTRLSIPDVIGRESGEGIFQDQDRIQHTATENATIPISKIGLWSAVLTVLSSAGYGIAVIAVLVYSLSIQSSSPSQGWSGIDAFLVAFQPIQMLPVIPNNPWQPELIKPRCRGVRRKT